jgi:glycogen debranching enzyme
VSAPSPAQLDADLVRDALALLRENDVGAFVKPAAHQYPHQWNWDSALVAIGLRHVDPLMARRELQTLLAAQWRSGMVPHIVYHGGASDYFPTPDFWRTEGLPHGGPIPSSGLTQPPVAATALRLLLDAVPDAATLAFAEEAVPQLLAWHRWFRRARDPEGTGLVAILHPWESGTDNAPRWADPLAALGTPQPPPYQRHDQRHVDASERPHPDEYARFMDLIGRYRDLGWDDAALWREAPFVVQDVLVNAILLRADADLAALCARVGADGGDELRAARARGVAAFRERLWDEGEGRYLDLDLRSGMHLRSDTWVTFAPLYAGIPGDAERTRLRERLRSPGRYAAGGEVRYAMPSVAADAPEFEPRRYWRGPVWINANWLVARGLRAAGLHDEADALRRDALELVRRSGFVEYYDPRDGSPCGARAFSWSAALAIDLLHDPEGV